MLSNQSHLFSLEEGITYLNTAYMSPQLKQVEIAGIEALRRKSRPYSIYPQDFFEPVQALKSLFAALIETPEAGRIALIPSVSYGMANVANNLPLQPGDEIVVLAEQFPSNVYPWMNKVQEAGAKLVPVAAPEQRQGRGAAWNQRLLAAIGPKTKMVAMAHVHWADGTKFDLAAIRAKTREVGAWLVIDGTQSVGALPFSVKDLAPDALICAGYKWLLGPYSSGFAYYGPAFDGGTPIENNWIARKNSDDFANLINYQPEYGPQAARYSVGEHSNFIQVPMLTAALQQLLAWTPAAIQAYTAHLAEAAIPELEALGCYIEPPTHRGHHLFGVHFPQDFPIERLKTRLSEAQVHVSYRGAFMRVAPHVFNQKEDFDTLVSHFKAVLG